MLLNYLYANFLEESSFTETVGTTSAELNKMIETCIFPSASYVYRCQSPFL